MSRFSLMPRRQTRREVSVDRLGGRPPQHDMGATGGRVSFGSRPRPCSSAPFLVCIKSTAAPPRLQVFSHIPSSFPTFCTTVQHIETTTSTLIGRPIFALFCTPYLSVEPRCIQYATHHTRFEHLSESCCYRHADGESLDRSRAQLAASCIGYACGRG